MKKLNLLLAAALLAVSAGTASADDGEGTSRNEAYLGLLLPYNAIGGDIDGNRGYINADGVAVVPELKNGLGLGFVLGLKHTGTSGKAFAIEGSLQGSSHDIEKPNGFDGDAAFGLLSGDFKFFPTTGGTVEPYVQAGLCVAALEVENGFITATGDKDATFTGGGFNLGLGILAYPSDRIGLHLAAIYRFIKYDEVDYDHRAELDDDLKGGTLSIELGATFRFNRS